MTSAVASAITACAWYPSQYLVLSQNVYAHLIYYSHFGAIIPSVLIALFIVMNNRKGLPGILLALSTLFFSLWVFGDLVIWATDKPEITMFFWTLINIAEPLVYFFLFYFFQTFIFKKDFTLLQKILFIIPVLPTIILAPTHFMLLGYDLSNCDRDAYEGILATYGYCIEIFYATFIVIFAVIAWIKEKNRTERKKIALLAFGITLFLLSFSIGNIVQVFTDNYYVDQYGLFGAPIFTAFLAYLIVRFKAFNLRLIGAQALVVALWLMVLALLFIPNINYIRIVTSITLIFVLILGILLVRGVNREIKQRERIELLAKDLEVANKQQIVLIHFITHQIKGFVTKSRNIFSMIMEGDLGPVPDAMRPMVEEGFRSDTKGANTIQEILNAANIRNGKVAYANDSYDLKELTEEIIKDLKPAADTKGLALTFAAEGESFTTIGDRMQMQNALKNLIDNSIKYTPSGSVAVSLKKEDGKIHFEIRDTGIGITEEDMQHLFTEGGHGKESQKVNVDSTGFGLFIVKNIIEAHHGKVWAESEGEGKGSQFIVELPA